MAEGFEIAFSANWQMKTGGTKEEKWFVGVIRIAVWQLRTEVDATWLPTDTGVEARRPKPLRASFKFGVTDLRVRAEDWITLDNNRIFVKLAVAVQL